MNDNGNTTTIHPAVRIGHVHLKVSDLDRSLRFYRDALGLTVTADGRPAGLPAVFLAAGDYHSHIALNTFESEGATPPPPGHSGLYHVAFLFPDRHELARAVTRLRAHDVDIHHASDHGGNRLGLPRRSRRQRHRAVLRPPARDVARRRRQSRPSRRPDTSRGNHRRRLTVRGARPPDRPERALGG